MLQRVIPPCAFRTTVERFNAFGAPTIIDEADGVPTLVNEFWTARQRDAHALHEISYRACFKPQLPAFFIERLTSPGDAVHDPFMGRGTTAIEAARLKRRVTGSDVNPLAALLVRPRLAAPDPTEVALRLDALGLNDAAPAQSELLAFYSPRTLGQLMALRRRLADPGVDPIDDWIRMVALNRLSGHSPGFFSVRSMPPNQAVSVASQLKINARLGQTPPDRDVAALILKKTQALLKNGSIEPIAPPALFVATADSTPAIPTAEIDLVVTSPPFLDVVRYEADNHLRNWFAGLDPTTAATAHLRSLSAWERMVRGALTELARIVRPGGHVAFEVGAVRKGALPLDRTVWAAAAGLPFERLFVMVNAQSFTKTAHCWGVANNAGGVNANRIVVLRRSG